MTTNKNIDHYIAAQPISFRDRLDEIRKFIHSIVPMADEVFSYQIPCYKYHGILVGFGVNNKGCSFYTTNPKLLATFDASELQDVRFSGSTIHFDSERPLPLQLIEKIIRLRMEENEIKARTKKQSQILNNN